MKMTDQDKRMFNALLHLLGQGSFALKWGEAKAYAQLFQWATDFQKRMNQPEKEENNVTKSGE